MKRLAPVCCALTMILSASTASAQPFTYNQPGQLVTGSGEGTADYNVYAPGMRFPIEAAPVYANSQVWGNGGMNGPGGGATRTFTGPSLPRTGPSPTSAPTPWG